MLLWSTQIFACRYNVRDLGFVDLGGGGYSLFLYIDDEFSGQTEHLRQKLSEELFNTNMEGDVINIDELKNELTMKYVSETELRSLPLLILVSPDKRVFVYEKSIQMDCSEYISESIRSTVDTVISDRIREIAAGNFAAVLFIEGSDPQANIKAKEECSKAIANIESAKNSLPKPFTEGPVIVTIDGKERKREKVLMWSVGLSDVSKTETDLPAAAIVYGRMRRMGPLLKGDEIESEKLTVMLSAIGADCECGLDRYWLMGKMMPHRWGKTLRDHVTKSLGFDPENPFIKIEMTSILGRGEKTFGRSDSINLSYKEIEVSFDDDPSPGTDKISKPVNVSQKGAGIKSVEKAVKNEPRFQNDQINNDLDNNSYQPAKLIMFSAAGVSATAVIIIISTKRKIK